MRFENTAFMIEPPVATVDTRLLEKHKGRSAVLGTQFLLEVSIHKLCIGVADGGVRIYTNNV